MKGSYRIRVENRRLVYEFSIRRNITIIRGNSATGKTTLIDMLSGYEQDAEESGIILHSEKNCVVLTDARWEDNLQAIDDSIVFVDEDYRFIRSEIFASAIRHSNNYYVLITRDNLENLPYSVEEIYGIRSSGKYAGLKKTYHELYRIYSDTSVKQVGNGAACIITEDSNSGNDFFTAAASHNIPCISAGGKSNIFRHILAHPDALHVVIADGSAFGPEMERIMNLARSGYKIILYLPESFEWLILSSGIIRGSRIRDVMLHPENYADSRQYFSWEQFFTDYLVEQTKNSYLRYAKSSLNPVYLHAYEKNAILKAIPESVRTFLTGQADT